MPALPRSRSSTLRPNNNASSRPTSASKGRITPRGSQKNSTSLNRTLEADRNKDGDSKSAILRSRRSSISSASVEELAKVAADRRRKNSSSVEEENQDAENEEDLDDIRSQGTRVSEAPSNMTARTNLTSATSVSKRLNNAPSGAKSSTDAPPAKARMGRRNTIALDPADIAAAAEARAIREAREAARTADPSAARQNVRVYCRFRPPLAECGEDPHELEEKGFAVITDPNNETVHVRRSALVAAGVMPEDLPALTIQAAAGNAAAPDIIEGGSFTFDRVFGMNAPQEEVFLTAALPLVDEVFAGYNCTIFAYGQTGSGKTHTMIGDLDSENRGIIPRLVEKIFDSIEEADTNIEFTLKVSYIEIYMERVRDLLFPTKVNLSIRETMDGSVYVKDSTEIYVNSYDQVLDIMHKGSKSRAIGTTKMNFESSRSHSVFILNLTQTDKDTGSRKASKLILVDLAGSEKVRKSEAAGHTLKEAQHINKSLSALGNVINHLTEGKTHVPYRDSKLTRLLTDSLGGNSKTTLIVTASPAWVNADESLSTLRFGQRAKRIKNQPKVNTELSVAEYQKLLKRAQRVIENQKEQILVLQRDIIELRQQLGLPTIDFAPIETPDLSAGVGPDGAKEAPAPSQTDLGALAAGAGQPHVGDVQGHLNPSEQHQLLVSGFATSPQLQWKVVSTLQSKVEHLEASYAEAEEVNAQLRDSLAEKESELEIQMQILEDRRDEVDELNMGLDAVRRRNRELEARAVEYAVFKRKIERAHEQLLAQIDQLEVENADLKAAQQSPNNSKPKPGGRVRLSATELADRARQLSSDAAESARIEAKLNQSKQAALADFMGVSRATSSGSDNGPRPPDVPITTPGPTSVGTPIGTGTLTGKVNLSSTPAPGGSGGSDREQELAAENRRLKFDAERRALELQAVQNTLEDLKKSKEPQGISVEVSMQLTKANNENQRLQFEVEKMKRQAETQERLLTNRQKHVELLESSIKEATERHRQTESQLQSTVQTLETKLEAAQRIIEMYAKGEQVPAEELAVSLNNRGTSNASSNPVVNAAPSGEKSALAILRTKLGGAKPANVISTNAQLNVLALPGQSSGGNLLQRRGSGTTNVNIVMPLQGGQHTEKAASTRNLIGDSANGTEVGGILTLPPHGSVGRKQGIAWSRYNSTNSAEASGRYRGLGAGVPEDSGVSPDAPAMDDDDEVEKEIAREMEAKRRLLQEHLKGSSFGSSNSVPSKA